MGRPGSRYGHRARATFPVSSAQGADGSRTAPSPARPARAARAAVQAPFARCAIVSGGVGESLVLVALNVLCTAERPEELVVLPRFGSLLKGRPHEESIPDRNGVSWGFGPLSRLRLGEPEHGR